MEYFIYNGKMLKQGTAIIGAGSRGLRFGDGLFETIKGIRGELQFADEHFARLWKGMSLLQFKIPVHFTPERLQEEIGELLQKNGHLYMARIRLTIVRGDGGLFDDTDHNPGYLIQTWALPENTGEWNSNGLMMGICNDVRKSCDLLSQIKHNNFLPYVMAALHAKKQKWNDAVVLNHYGRICDTAVANIFLIKDGLIYTPSLDEGCIAGIMRKNMLRHLLKEGRTVMEAKITADDLLAADEVFVTNSIHNMRWVQGIGDKSYSNSLTLKIYSSFLSTIT